MSRVQFWQMVFNLLIFGPLAVMVLLILRREEKAQRPGFPVERKEKPPLD